MAFNWHNPYPTVRIPLFARNVVSTSHPLAAQAGVRILLAGGNAVDAAIATAAMLTVVEPVACGLGGDAFAILWDGAQLHGLNASGPAPASWNLDDFRKRHGEDEKGHARIPQRGWDTATVPGVIAGWAALHNRFGTLPFGDLMGPAAEVAERGITIAPVVAGRWEKAVPILQSHPGFSQTFMPNGRAPHVGEKFQFPGAAKTLRLLAAQGAGVFYEGEIGEAIAAWAQKTGGGITMQDLRDYAPEWVDPISVGYQGYEVHELPPNGQGIAALIALGILKHFDIASLPLDSVESQHLQIEAMKLAFADVWHYVADPAAMRVTPQQMLDDAYLASRAKSIDRKKAGHFAYGMPASGGTVYLTVADENGMMISFIQSNFKGFGSGVVVPGYGVSLQNRGSGFSGDPASANALAPGKKPYHTIIPAFLTQNGLPRMSFGVMGGDMQPQGHVQTVIRMLDYKQQPQAACDAPRWKINTDFSVNLESRVDPATVATLQSYGHNVNVIDDPYADFGSGQFIWRLSDDMDHGYVAASDSRRDGQAAGF